MFKIAICEDDKYQIDINKLLINKWAEKKEISLSIRSFLSAEEFIIKNESIIEYDCIIIDVGLKKINGIELAKIIRENNKAKEDAITVDCRHRCNGCGINSTDLGRGLC